MTSASVNFYIKVLKWLGLSCIFLSPKTNTYCYSKWYNWITGALLALGIVAILYGTQYLWVEFTATSLLTIKLINIMYFGVPLLHLNSVLIIVKSKQGDLVYIFNVLHRLDEILKTSHKRIYFARINLYIVVYVTIVVVSYTGMFFYIFHVYPDGPDRSVAIDFALYYVISLYHLVLRLLTDTFVTFVTLVLSFYFQESRYLVIKAFQNDNLELLIQVVRVHQQLCQDTRGVARKFSLLLLLVWALHFMVFFMHFAGICAKIFYGTDEYKFGFLGFYFIVQLGSSMVLMTYAATRCAFQANKMRQDIFKIISKTRNAHLKREANAFSLQLGHEKFVITAGGFFKVDYSLLMSVLAASCTYTIITIQFVSAKI